MVGKIPKTNPRIYGSDLISLSSQVTVKGTGGVKDDVYRIKFGFRTIKVTEKAFLINGMPFYFKGFGMHEDADVSSFFFIVSMIFGRLEKQLLS